MKQLIWKCIRHKGFKSSECNAKLHSKTSCPLVGRNHISRSDVELMGVFYCLPLSRHKFSIASQAQAELFLGEKDLYGTGQKV